MIDWSRVNELRNEVGEEDFNDIIDLFLQEVAEVLDRLNAQQGDLAENLHFLKGSALSIGFSALAELCRQGEIRASSSQPGMVDVQAIVELFQRSKRAFQAGLSGDAAA